MTWLLKCNNAWLPGFCSYPKAQEEHLDSQANWLFETSFNQGLISLMVVSQSSNGYVISMQGNRVVKLITWVLTSFLPCGVNGELVVALQRKCSPTTFLAVYIDLICRIMLKSNTLWPSVVSNWVVLSLSREHRALNIRNLEKLIVGKSFLQRCLSKVWMWTAPSFLLMRAS